MECDNLNNVQAAAASALCSLSPGVCKVNPVTGTVTLRDLTAVEVADTCRNYTHNISTHTIYLHISTVWLNIQLQELQPRPRHVRRPLLGRGGRHGLGQSPGESLYYLLSIYILSIYTVSTHYLRCIYTISTYYR